MNDEDKIKAILALSNYVHNMNNQLVVIEAELLKLANNNVDYDIIVKMEEALKEMRTIGVGVRLDLISLFANHVTDERRLEDGDSTE